MAVTVQCLISEQLLVWITVQCLISEQSRCVTRAHGAPQVTQQSQCSACSRSSLGVSHTHTDSPRLTLHRRLHGLLWITVQCLLSEQFSVLAVLQGCWDSLGRLRNKTIVPAVWLLRREEQSVRSCLPKPCAPPWEPAVFVQLRGLSPGAAHQSQALMILSQISTWLNLHVNFGPEAPL